MHWKPTRDTKLFLIGLGLLVSQVVLSFLNQPVSDPLVTGGIGLLLSPLLTRQDDKRREKQ